MRAPFQKSDRIAGLDIPRRRFTLWAVVYFMVYFVTPILAVALALDTLFFLIFDRWFGACYGVLCLIG